MTRELDARERLFVSEYLIDLDVERAAIAAGLPLARCESPRGYYVYILADEYGRAFYVGKGTGRRYRNHMTRWASARFDNGVKHAAISAIHARGGHVSAWCFAEGLGEDAAFALERALIAAIGRHRLTNLIKGQLPKRDRNRLLARAYLDRMIPREEWMARRAWTEMEIVLADRVRAEMAALAA